MHHSWLPVVPLLCTLVKVGQSSMVSSTDAQLMDDVLEHDPEETLTLDQLVESYQD